MLGGVSVARQRADAGESPCLVPRAGAGSAKQAGMGCEVVQQLGKTAGREVVCAADTRAFLDMDGLGEMDDVIFLQDLKVEVCEEFFRLYPGDMPGDVIFDYEANGKRYPGDVFGRHVKVYAITWSTTDPIEYCDIEWVMQYNVPASPKPGRN